MPTPSETLHGIRAEAQANLDALASVEAEAKVRLVQVSAWLPTASKGILRDQLARLIGSYAAASAQAVRTVAVATQAIEAIGTGGDPDVAPVPTTWSTGDW